MLRKLSGVLSPIVTLLVPRDAATVVELSMNWTLLEVTLVCEMLMYDNARSLSLPRLLKKTPRTPPQ